MNADKTDDHARTIRHLAEATKHLTVAIARPDVAAGDIFSAIEATFRALDNMANYTPRMNEHAQLIARRFADGERIG